MRLFVVLTFLSGTVCASFAQPVPKSTEQLPAWMYELLTGSRPTKPFKPSGAPLHTNAFIGTWNIEGSNGQHIEGWADAHRLVFRMLDEKNVLHGAVLVDLAANVRVDAHWSRYGTGVRIHDVRIPQGHYYHELWNDTVVATGRTQMILGSRCAELAGVNVDQDSTWYWRADVHPALFADIRAWGKWVREGDLQHLLAFSDKHAGSSLRVDWSAQKHGTAASSLWFTAITPGQASLPQLDLAGAAIEDERLAWINNRGTGRLPEWMRTRLSNMPPDPVPVAYTPPAVDRHIPDNAFIGTLTAERSRMVLGLKPDTIVQAARYSYWADARRAVLQLDDPGNKGTITYMVDLDADVVIASVNEGHSNVVPKLYIGTLENIGLEDFGRGGEVALTATGTFRIILGHRCELHAIQEQHLSQIWISDVRQNPVFDMAHWLERRLSRKFQDLMLFGLADKPMPFAVAGTRLTSFKPGKAQPPAIDLSNSIVRDQRLEQGEAHGVQRSAREMRDDVTKGTETTVQSDGVPEMVQAEAYPDPPAVRVDNLSTQAHTEVPPAHATTPLVYAALSKRENQFMGSAVLEFTETHGGTTYTWQVAYWSTLDSCVLVSKGDGTPLPTARSTAYILNRRTGKRTQYILWPDSTLRINTASLITPDDGHPTQFLQDTLVPGDEKKIAGQNAQLRMFRAPGLERRAYVSTTQPSIYLDLLSAARNWGPLSPLLHGEYFTISEDGHMPMEVRVRDGNATFTMKVLKILPGWEHLRCFAITKDSWKR